MATEEPSLSLIVAVIPPSKLDEVREALDDISVLGMTVTETRGFGFMHGQSRVYKGAVYSVDFSSQVRIEVVVSSSRAREAVDAIKESARTGEMGDVELLVLPVSQVFRIRTGETGEDALGVALPLGGRRPRWART